MLLQINGITKKYLTPDGEVTALDRASLSVSAGEFVAIVGKSGSGKTTLLNMIARLDTPDDGSIFIGGEEITRLSEKRSAELRRRKIGVIYQFYNLVPELNISDNITLPTELDGGAVDERWLREILLKVGLSGRERSYPSALSGGEQQRVAIARAIFNKPALIIADEPTGNLDSETGDEILELLKYMNGELGATLIVVTHSERVASAASRVVRVQGGRITDDGRRK